MAKTSGRAANLGKFLHPSKKKSPARAAKRIAPAAPISVGAFDVGTTKPKGIKPAR